MEMQTNETVATQRTTGRRWIVLVAVLVLALAGAGVAALGSDPAEPAIELSLGESNALASCLAFDPAVLAGMPTAFLGTATTVDGSTVTLTVDRWFAGGDAATVSLVGDQQSPALIAGFEFQPGEQYLVSATDGTVNYCGYSGPVTPELLAGYEAAF